MIIGSDFYPYEYRGTESDGVNPVLNVLGLLMRAHTPLAEFGRVIHCHSLHIMSHSITRLGFA